MIISTFALHPLNGIRSTPDEDFFLIYVTFLLFFFWFSPKNPFSHPCHFKFLTFWIVFFWQSHSIMNESMIWKLRSNSLTVGHQMTESNRRNNDKNWKAWRHVSIHFSMSSRDGMKQEVQICEKINNELFSFSGLRKKGFYCLLWYFHTIQHGISYRGLHNEIEFAIFWILYSCKDLNSM